jgi:hypothetical protein
MDPAAPVEDLCQTKAAKTEHGMTVAEIIEARIGWMQVLSAPGPAAPPSAPAAEPVTRLTSCRRKSSSRRGRV